MLLNSSSSSSDSKIFVDDVFATVVRTGTGATATITTGFQPDLVWTKDRAGAGYDHVLVDSARGITNRMQSNQTAVQYSDATLFSSFNTDGYTLGNGSGSGLTNNSGRTYVDWVFKKKAKFFDVVTYTGNGDGSKLVNHSLSVAPGMVVVKRTDTSGDWFVYHASSSGVNSARKFLKLNTTDAISDYDSAWGGTNESVFRVNSAIGTNTNGATYVAYLFAHDTSADGIIQCGSYTGNAGTQDLNLGWEPQFFLAKRVSAVGDWGIIDVMRGWSHGTENILKPNTSGVEDTGNTEGHPTATGIRLENGNYNQAATYIYLAIRRPNKPPTTGTQVYNAIARTGTGAAATVTGVGFAPDLAVIQARAENDAFWNDRLRGVQIRSSSASTAAEVTDSAGLTAYAMDGISLGASVALNQSSIGFINHFFRRAPGVFSICAYQGDGATSQVVSHDLGVVPELVINKSRSARGWTVFRGSTTTLSGFLQLHTTAASGGDSLSVSATTITPSLGAGFGMNANAENYITYLFATKAGISKVGEYTGNGTSQNLEMGFSAGCRFFLCKRTDSTGDWYVWDSTRGITASNDPRLSLNTTAAEVTTDDSVDPFAAGITVNQVAATNINVNGASYIYLAFA